jgi:NAD(P)-dependent dehydrogenase (short-subunit alcohol dehydrogenase family)
LCNVTQGGGSVALVSAGSRGIGAAIVGRLAARGWDVSFGYDRDEHSAREVERAARELGARVIAVRWTWPTPPRSPPGPGEVRSPIFAGAP